MKKQLFQVLIVFKDGDKRSIGTRRTKEEAEELIKENTDYNKYSVKEIGKSGLSIDFEEAEGAELAGYIIRSRYVSEWELEEKIHLESKQ